jgi:hypothetical protein
MSIKEKVTTSLDSLDEAELQQVAEFVAFLKFQARVRKNSSRHLDNLATLYAEFAEEDRELAEEGFSEYAHNLVTEDAK